MVAMPLCQAVSDTDVYLIKAEEVTIEEEKITIVGSARLKMVVIKDNHDRHTRGTKSGATTWVFAKADKATFGISQTMPII